MTGNDLNHQIGAALRQARLSRGVTQDDLARLLAVDRVTISRYEHGTRPLPLASLLQIATYLEQPASVLLPTEHQAPMIPPATPEQAAVQSVVQVLTDHPELVPTVLDLLETMLEAQR
jgi:transcriptional regulator with XRE-family HTH domain